MAIKAAVASSDGKVINLHFGKADRFLIFEEEETGFRYKETREITPCCNLGDHEADAFSEAAEVLSDCEYIIVGRIGPPAADYLSQRGFTVFESPFGITDVLDILFKDLKERQNGN